MSERKIAERICDWAVSGVREAMSPYTTVKTTGERQVDGYMRRVVRVIEVEGVAFRIIVEPVE